MEKDVGDLKSLNVESTLHQLISIIIMFGAINRGKTK